MKRFNEFEEVNESLVLKRVRIFDGIGETDGGFEITQDEEERVLSNNGVVDSSEGYGTEATGDLERAKLGGLTVANEWDFDINFNMLFGSKETKHGSGFDLNAMLEGGTDMGFLEFTQGPLLNRNKAEVIEILSDDDDTDDEVEIIEVRSACTTNVDQMKAGESDMIEIFNLGLELNQMNYFVGESSSMASCERRYTGEEREKDNTDHSWLSLRDHDPIGVDLWPDCEFPMDVDELRKVIEFIPQHPADLSEMPIEFESDLRLEESAPRQRLTPIRAVSRETAMRLARANYPGEKSNIELAIQEKKTSTSDIVDQLGKSFGLFSDAFKIIKERTLKKADKELIEWKPSKVNGGRRITLSPVPSLLKLSLKGLAENAGSIVSLELIPDLLRHKLVDMLCDSRKLDVHILNLLVEGYPTEIRIKNCSWLTEEQFQQTLANCQTQYLRVLQLDLCGQILFDLAFRDAYTRSVNRFSSLAMVSLRGACRLSDTGLKELLVAAPALQSINLGQCTLLTSEGINSIADFLGSNLRELYIDDCQKIDSVEILPAFKKLKKLEILSVAGIQTVTDQFVSEVAVVCGPRIKELDLANCLELTDCSLKVIGSNCFDLRSLNLSNLHNLTDLGMAYLANGCRSIQKLKLCRNKFSDEAIAAFLESSGWSLSELSLNNVTEVWQNTALSLARCASKLLSLDLSWCRRITNEAVGLIVDSCSSLMVLKIFGCRQITGIFVNGHSNPNVRIIGLNLTPILENINSIEPDEVLGYSTLPTPESTI